MTTQQWRAYVSTPGFWLHAIVQAIGILLTFSLIKRHPEVAEVLAGASLLINQIATQAIAAWNAPRDQWTNEQRIAKGLAPVQDITPGEKK